MPDLSYLMGNIDLNMLSGMMQNLVSGGMGGLGNLGMNQQMMGNLLSKPMYM